MLLVQTARTRGLSFVSFACFFLCGRNCSYCSNYFSLVPRTKVCTAAVVFRDSRLRVRCGPTYYISQHPTHGPTTLLNSHPSQAHHPHPDAFFIFVLLIRCTRYQVYIFALTCTCCLGCPWPVRFCFGGCIPLPPLRSSVYSVVAPVLCPIRCRFGWMT